jgi:hypothetical protein
MSTMAHSRCAFKAAMGRKLKWLPTSKRYIVCLSPSQRKALFGERTPEKLGCGAFACAWATDKAYVTKITRDATDVAGMLRAQGLLQVAEVKHAWELSRAAYDERGKAIPDQTWAMRVERLRPLNQDEKNRLGPRLRAVGDAFDKVAQGYRGPKASFRIPQKTLERLNKSCRDKKCTRFLLDVAEAYTELYRRGILWRDMHTGNIGIARDGRWKILELGARSGVCLRRKLPVLQGGYDTSDSA